MAQANIEGSVDRISSLPDSVLGHILSFLPTKVAVSSCISLCRSRWKVVFPFTNNLDFDESLVNDPESYYSNDTTNLFMDFVDRCIMLMNGKRIDKFRLKCSDIVDNSRIHSWICAALCSNVRELDVYIGTRELGKEYSRIFTCNTLVVLKLSTDFSLNDPASVYLPCLKILHFGSIKLLHTIQSLVSSCPVLDDLLIRNCYVPVLDLSSPSLKRLSVRKPSDYRPYALVLDMPSLIHLRFVVCNGGHILKTLGSLCEVHIHISNKLSDPIARHELLEMLGNVQSLYLSGEVRKLLRTTFNVLEELPLFENLTRLVLTDKPYLKMSMVMKLLQCCPNLEEFVYNGSIQGGYDVPFCMPSRLESIECELFYNNRGVTNHREVESLEYFLKNADMLERMRIHFWWYCSVSHREVDEKLETMMETMKRLAKDPSRSRTCELNVFLAKFPDEKSNFPKHRVKCF